jgi:hypothetical protein
MYRSKTYTIRFANEKLLCRKNIQDNLGLNMPGKSFLRAQGKLAGTFLDAFLLELKVSLLNLRRLPDL